MKKRLVLVAIGIVMALDGSKPVSAQSRWSFEASSPLWSCLIQCAGVPSTDELTVCLQTCGMEHDSGRSSAQEAADRLRCQASMMRAEAAQFSCHSHCLSMSDGPETDLVGCIDGCDERYETRTALLLRTARCAALRAAD